MYLAYITPVSIHPRSARPALDGFSSEHLYVGRIAVLAQNALDDDLELGFKALLDGSVDGGILLDLFGEDDGELEQLVFMYELPGAVVFGDGRIESVFVFGEAHSLRLLVHAVESL